MSVTVKHLNGDTSFLLTFSPAAHPLPEDLKPGNGVFTVLTDPCLDTSSVFMGPWLPSSLRVTPSAIGNLSEIEEPDVVIVSQNKPDHCHKDTLLQLRPEGKSVIVAEPDAAKAIRSWKHFDPNRVQALAKYNTKTRFGNSFRVRIPPRSANGDAGELSISFIPAQKNMMGLHNAFCIVYVAPTHTKTVAAVPTIDLPKSTKYFHMPIPPAPPVPISLPVTNQPQFMRPVSVEIPRRTLSQPPGASQRQKPGMPQNWNNTVASARTSLSERRYSRAYEEIAYVVRPFTTTPVPDKSPRIDLPFDFEVPSPARRLRAAPPTPPDSPPPPTPARPMTAPSSARRMDSPKRRTFQSRRSAVAGQQVPLANISSMAGVAPMVTPARPKAISVIYAPHGVPYSDLLPYIKTHLLQHGALPLTLLLHSFDQAQLPWYLGGNVTAGAPGGITIARSLMARCWLSAHDEVRGHQTGVSAKHLRVNRIGAEEIRKQLWEGDDGECLRRSGWMCDVRKLDVGKDLTLGQARDLLSGMEGNRQSRLLRFGVG
ncbi:hypothetical protein DV736_g1236, partial [Chaetothyriales sp. CBS 134916]